MYWVYILWSDKLGKRYIGCTQNIEKRLKEHNYGSSSFTSGGIPWVLIHGEQFADKTGARKRELFLKSGAGRKWLDQLLSGQLD